MFVLISQLLERFEQDAGCFWLGDPHDAPHHSRRPQAVSGIPRVSAWYGEAQMTAHGFSCPYRPT